MRNLPLEISISSPTTMDSRDDGTVRVQIRDAVSGETLAYLEMTPGRFWRLCQGSHMSVEGEVSDNLDRVGKKMLTETISVPREVTKGNYTNPEADVRSWLADGNQPAHWETVSSYHSNHGWIVTGRWWVNVTEQEMIDYRAGNIISCTEVK